MGGVGAGTAGAAAHGTAAATAEYLLEGPHRRAKKELLLFFFSVLWCRCFGLSVDRIIGRNYAVSCESGSQERFTRNDPARIAD